MISQKTSKLRTLIPALWISILDIFVTVFYQNPQYWEGDLSKASEANPIGGTAMQIHVSGIFIVCGIWLVVIPILGYYLPRRWSKLFLLFVLIAHTVGALSWILPRYGYWWLVILSAFNAIIYLYFNDELKQAGEKDISQHVQ